MKRLAFTMSRGAFTMAEILLSLTIIGVVAAITLPSLTGNINERTWNTQRKALYSRISQAISLMPALNGYGTYIAPSGTEGTESYNAGTDNAAETFITAGLSKVLKINNICDSNNLADCGIPDKINPLDGGIAIERNNMINLYDFNPKMGMWMSPQPPNTKAAALETQNGESILVHYNPQCAGNLGEKTYGGDTHTYYIQKRICVNFIYDLNGTKGPNTVGKDIGFMTALYPYDAQLYAPYPASTYKQIGGNSAHNHTTAMQYCKNEMGEDYRLAKADELASMFVNNKLLGSIPTEGGVGTGFQGYFISTDTQGAGIRISQHLFDGSREEQGNMAWCVKRN